MLITDFDYDLPDEFIAQEPTASRDGSRMLIVDRTAGLIGDGQFIDLAQYLREDDLLVLNRTRVFPARL